MINIEEERKAFEIEWIKLGGDFKSFSIIDNMYVLIPSMASADNVIKEFAERAVNSAFALWLIQSRQKQVVIDDMNIQLKDAKATPEGFVFNDVFAERKRQIDQEHYSHEHDDEYDQNELIRAASSYLSHVIGRGWVFKETCPETYQDEEAPDLWPWDLDFWKPKNPRCDLVRAAALIIAEIEKIDRITGAKS